MQQRLRIQLCVPAIQSCKPSRRTKTSLLRESKGVLWRTQIYRLKTKVAAEVLTLTASSSLMKATALLGNLQVWRKCQVIRKKLCRVRNKQKTSTQSSKMSDRRERHKFLNRNWKCIKIVINKPPNSLENCVNIRVSLLPLIKRIKGWRMRELSFWSRFRLRMGRFSNGNRR